MINGLRATTHRAFQALSTTLLLSGFLGHAASGQDAGQRPPFAMTTDQKLQQLTAALAQTQAQLSSYQQQLQDLQQQLVKLQQQVIAERGANAEKSPPAIATRGAAPSGSANPSEELREHQAIEESQIATLDQTKIETESKYPLKVSGLLLFNGFVNTRQVDVAPDPTYALPGSGSTGFSLRQTVLGVDARGPHIFGASSRADMRVDFFATGSTSAYSAGGILRLRTAHATLDWPKTEAFVELDRPLISPNAPTSLVATAQPEFAWSGNLWAWNPQIGVSQQATLTDSKQLKFQAALIDVADPAITGTPAATSSLSRAENSRWPGTEARITFSQDDPAASFEIGAGGYFSPHRTFGGVRFNAWAGSVDTRMTLKKRFEATANVYRGQALGGLGGGGYIDYLYKYVGPTEITVPLDTVGGWSQLKAKVGTRLEFNGGFGIDNPFAGEIRASLSDQPYSGLARNRSAFGNVIYSPTAYLLFSLEYRRLWTNYSAGPASTSDVIGIGAGYRF